MLGQISLNISFGLYLVFLWPQIFHNALRKNTKQLSLTMHLILVLAYFADLLYGFGRDFPWQYKAVTISGLLALLVQHLQFYLYNLHNSFFKLISVVLLICALASFYALFGLNLPQSFFIGAGIVSQIGWFLYAIPQIYHNAKQASVDGLSLYFVLLALIIAICDTISAWSLNWDWPSKIGSPLSSILKLVLFAQFVYYSSKPKLKNSESQI